MYSSWSASNKDSSRITIRVLQSPWLRDYIQLNTDFRTRANNDFEKNLYKLMNTVIR